MALDLEPTVTLPWLVRLRWLFFAGQVAVLAVSRIAAGNGSGSIEGQHDGILLAAVAGYGLSNLALVSFGRRLPSPSLSMGAVLILDGILLTAMLAASGGSSNPFSVLYLVHITLSALVLGARWTFAISALCIFEFGLLFLLPTGHVMHHGAAGFDQHLYGMFAAFVLAAGLTAFFVGRIARAIAAQREQIAALREDAARNARLASVTTLAAGAAHELGSPLATIAVAAHEASLRAAAQPATAAIAEDLALILLEVDRCQDILQQLAARSAQSDDSRPVSLAEVAAKVRDILRPVLGEAHARRLELVCNDPQPALRVPVEQLAQSISGLVRNSLDASGAVEPVRVTLERDPTSVRITVEDRGAGISPELLARVGEPFFTTKEPGRGLGLGVFLARTFFESYGGGLRLESTPGQGTRVLAHLPRERAP
jgi:two-component system, sensor histidine kinase RegB